MPFYTDYKKTQHFTITRKNNMKRVIENLAAQTALHLLVSAQVFAASLPDAPDGDEDPIEIGTQILEYILDGIMTIGAGVAVVSLGYCIAKSITSGRMDGQRAAMIGIGGAGLAGVSFLGNMVLGN
ncbi:MAG: hypothetical protein CMM62_00155 [Rhodospirillaceae bacterium]|nr:hypothetical protein [Rhodospirillaceae bacterium]MAX65183.1 hypothetical protein [Rhodospirillaceae bacterium]MBB58582.1 hypothetical protein [Rhodospirillaceae bacterium]